MKFLFVGLNLKKRELDESAIQIFPLLSAVIPFGVFKFAGRGNPLNERSKSSFCIDNSNAYSFGYEMVSDKKQDLFINFLENTIGIDRIILIHLNDSKKKLGSRVDQHAVIGEGYIGKKSLIYNLKKNLSFSKVFI